MKTITITYDPKMHALVRKSLLEDVRRTLDEMIDAAPQQEEREGEPGNDEIDAMAMRCSGDLHGDVLHMTRAQRIAFARMVLAHQPPPAQAEGQEPPKFPTALRKMWSGSEVQAWINEHWTTPPRREWVGLTAGERLDAMDEVMGGDTFELIDAIEAKLKEKNA